MSGTSGASGYAVSEDPGDTVTDDWPDAAIGPNYLLTGEERARDWVLPEGSKRESYFRGEASIEPDDRTLGYRFFGDPEEVSDVAAIEVVETAGSVAVSHGCSTGQADGATPRWARAHG